MLYGKPEILILGTRGVPAAHGGFETFAERFATHLVEQGWPVSIYCQIDDAGTSEAADSDTWNGIGRIFVKVAARGPKATLIFDWLCVRDAVKRDAICLVLGYNGAVFLPYLRWRGKAILTNMDGIEWRRPKWNRAIKAWFYVNEWIAARSSHRLIADHPAIADHLASRYPGASIATIPYGGDRVEDAAEEPMRAFGLAPGRYLLSVCRIEPDNNVLEIVQAFSRERRDAALVVLGPVDAGTPYGRAIRAAASAEVMFPGPIYDAGVMRSLRFHARAYMHGHMAGGTNPSLVEALWAGNAVVAHDNAFNRWTAGGAGLFFRTVEECASRIGTILNEPGLAARLGAAARARAAEAFRWSEIFQAYETEFRRLAEVGSETLPGSVEQLQERSI